MSPTYLKKGAGFYRCYKWIYNEKYCWRLWWGDSPVFLPLFSYPSFCFTLFFYRLHHDIGCTRAIQKDWHFQPYVDCGAARPFHRSSRNLASKFHKLLLGSDQGFHYGERWTHPKSVLLSACTETLASFAIKKGSLVCYCNSNSMHAKLIEFFMFD